LINFPAVQTWLCQRVAGYYSSKWHTKVRVGHVDLEFLKKLVLKDVYVEDQHGDTLLSAGILKLSIGALDFKKHNLYVSNIDIENTKVHLVTYKNTHELNLQFIIDAFASKDTTTKSGGPIKWDISSGGITLNNVDFHLQNLNDTETVEGMNYANLRVHNIYGRISDIKFEGDTVRGTMERLSANEASGFVLKNMFCYIKLSTHGMELDALHIVTPQTDLSTDLVFHYERFRDFDDFVTKVRMHAVFKKSQVCFEDVAFFAPGLKGVHNCFSITGQYDGTISDLHGKDMEIGWGKFSTFQGDADMVGLTDIDKTQIRVHIAELTTSKYEIETLPLPPFDKQQSIKLPDNIAYFNTIHFTGNFDGYISDFNTDGILNSDIGEIAASLHLRQDTVKKIPYYKGTIQTKGFDIGKFLQIKDMGAITSNTTIEGDGLSKERADAKIDGSIQGLNYKKYNYQNTTLNGELKKGFFSGTVQVNDPNLRLNFNGIVDIASKVHTYKFDANIYHSDLMAMHIVKDTNSPAILSSHIKIDAEGNTLDEIAGTLHIDSTNYYVHRQQYHLNHLVLVSDLKSGFRSVDINSDYMDADISGHYSPLNSVACFKGLLANYLPDKFPKEMHIKNNKDFHDYNFNIRFKENTGLTDLFIPTLKIADGTTVKGYYKERGEEFSLTGQSPLIELNGRKAKDSKITATGDNSELKAKINADTLFMSDSLYAAGFNINSNIANDTVHYFVKWNNDSANNASIPGFIAFTRNAETVFKLLSPQIDIADSTWQLNKQNMVTVDTSGITAQDLMFYHGQQYISVIGKLSNKKSDALVIDFHKFNLEDLLITSPTLKGTVDGTASISNANNHFLFVSALTFNDVYFNKEYLGNASINSYWDNTSQSIATNGQVDYYGNKTLSFIGNYYPNKDSNNINVDGILNGFLIKTFNQYTKGYCSDMDGILNGNFNLSGNLNRPVFHGNVVANIKKIKVDYLNTYYHTPELNITIAPDTFKIISSRLYDDKGDTAVLSGNLYHSHFHNFRLDFGMTTNNFYCLNTKDDNESSYFGQGYVSGNASFYGYLNSIHIDANITTQKGTVFNIPLSNASEVEESDFIHFVNKNDPKTKKRKARKTNPGGLQMDFNIHVTSDAIAKLIFASKVGDILTSSGSGNIEFAMNNLGDISLRGSYIVTDGSYRFVLQNVINEDFNLRPGGTIQWNGDPYNAEINIQTSHMVRTPLQPLFPFDTTHAQYSKSVPVYCDLDLSGKLTSPDIKFDVELPTVDQETRQTVASYLSNPDEMNRQVFSLLIIKSFLPVQQGASSSTAPTPSIIPGVAGYSILSSQLTNLLNSISNKVNIGVNYNPATMYTPQEAQLLLTTELLGGRVLINTDISQIGTTSTGAQTENSNNVVGEAAVEYLLTKDGKLRVKAFNKANDNTALNLLNAPYTQGAGVSYKESFNTFGELWDKIKGKFKKGDTKKQDQKNEVPIRDDTPSTLKLN